MDINYITQLVADYRYADETDEWDFFCEKYGDMDDLCDTLIRIIEERLLNI